MNVRHSHRITDIGAGPWRALDHSSPVADYEWQRTMDAFKPSEGETEYWWIEDGRGVVAVVAGYLEAGNSLHDNADRQRYGPVARAVRSLRSIVQPRPTLVCGAQFSPGNPVLLREGLGPQDRRFAFERLVEAVEAYCRARRINLYFFSMLREDAVLDECFSGRGYLRTPGLPNTVLDICWDSWEAYLDHLKVNHPSTEKSIRSQVNRGRRDGVVIEEVDDPSVYEEDIHRILTEHYFRKNQRRLSLDPHFPSILKKNMGDGALMYIARKQDRVIGASIYIRNRVGMHWKYFGIANEAVRSRNAVYFNLAFHHPIEQACRAGCKFIVMGTLPYRVKQSRGARLLPVSSWAWQPNPLLRPLQRIPLAYAAWRQKKYLEPRAD